MWENQVENNFMKIKFKKIIVILYSGNYFLEKKSHDKFQLFQVLLWFISQHYRFFQFSLNSLIISLEQKETFDQPSIFSRIFRA